MVFLYCTVPASRVVTRTLRMSVLQSHSRVKHFPPSLSTDVTVTVNSNSILLDIHVPCKVFGTLRTTTALVRVYVVELNGFMSFIFYLDVKYRY